MAARRSWRPLFGRRLPRLVAALLLAALLAGANVLPGIGTARSAGWEVGDQAVVATDWLNLRHKPGLNALVQAVLPQGHLLSIMEEPVERDGYTWYGVRTQADLGSVKGWVAGEFLAMPGQFSAGDAVTVADGPLNLRAEPGLDAAILRVLPDGFTMTVTSGPVDAEGYAWYGVAFHEGASDEGWVAGDFLTLAQNGGDGWDNGIAAGDVAAVDTARLNCRSGPGLDHDVIYVMTEGETVDVLEGPEEADGYHWFRVRTDDGDVGWVIGEALTPAGSDGAFEVGDAVRVVDGELNLRAAPGLSAGVKRVLADNEALVIREGPVVVDGYNWYRVWNFGGEGWAAGEYLRFDPNGFPGEDGA